MKTSFHATTALTPLLKNPTVVAIGNFDGVHFGHQQILKKARAWADAHALKLVVLTFEPHPVKILAPSVAPLAIQTVNQKIKCLKDSGADFVVLQKFDSDFAKIPPEDFFAHQLVRDLKASAVFVGYDFTFGKKRSGTTETLEQLGHKHNVAIKIVAAQMQKDTLVSSTLIRKLLQNGSVREAAALLTRYYQMDGEVVPGFKRGTSLGIHTANLKPENEILLSDGVYATFAELSGKIYPAATNIGLNPTFENTARSIETHIFDFDREIYQETLRLHFVEKIRDEIKFVSPQALVKQIEKDILQTRAILKKSGIPKVASK